VDGFALEEATTSHGADELPIANRDLSADGD
jgi:hypothetical protein